MVDIYVSHKEDKDEKREVVKEKKQAPEKFLEKEDKEGSLPVEIGNGKTTNRLAAFAINPIGVRFANQEKDEKILLLLRKHWVTNIPWIFIGILLFLAPLALKGFPIISFLPANYQLMAIIIWYLGFLAFVFENFLTWYFNAGIVTNKRVVDIDFYNLLYKEVSEARIGRIQDVTVVMSGAIRVIFRYGDVLIQTAGSLPNFEFGAVPRPSQVAQALEKLRIEQEPV